MAGKRPRLPFATVGFQHGVARCLGHFGRKQTIYKSPVGLDAECKVDRSLNSKERVSYEHQPPKFSL